MEGTRTITMKTNFEGLIYLLADGLYSRSDIFVRELIQNGHDGIVSRQAQMSGPDYQGAISVSYDLEEHSISFSDNGIGMDEQDIINFLSVIGSTGSGVRRCELEAMFADKLIGRFGIGLLSSFLVAGKVCVQTKKLGSDKAFQWINTGSVECVISPIRRESVGSTVTVYLRPEFNYLLDQKKLEEIIIRYCDFISVPISLNGVGPVNAVNAPWDKDYDSYEQKLDSYVDFVNRRFPNMYMDIFPIQIEKTEQDGQVYRAKGVFYITKRDIAGGSLDIFVRNMLIKERDNTLLPSWAKFIRGIIDSPDLLPTAGRDNVNQDSTAFKVIQRESGELIIQRLIYLAENSPDKFMYINSCHNEHLKSMAIGNEEFLRKVEKILLFNTNDGSMPLSEYLGKNALIDGKMPIYYFTQNDSAAQYFRLAKEKGLCVINTAKLSGGGRYDEQLLEMYKERHPEVVLQKLNDLKQDIIFTELTREERVSYHQLETAISNRLDNRTRQNIVASTKLYAPATVPAIIIEAEDEKIEREIQTLLNSSEIRENFGGVLDKLSNRLVERPIHLTLNSSNRLVQLLTEHSKELHQKDMQSILTVLYDNALIYSHQLTERSMNIVHDDIVQMMTRLVEILNNNNQIMERLKAANELINELQNKTVTQMNASPIEYIRLFMITPFDDSYKPVETAVRQVFEKAPFYFQVQLARDAYKADTLVKNIQCHIADAHCFVAEISELNPNVMMEVGGILINGDTRPVFALRDKKSREKGSAPVDFGDRLTFSYGSRADSSELIAKQIKDQLFKDGRLVHVALKELKKVRKKCFLSRTLLEGFREVTLRDDAIETICHKFATVEDFLDAKEEQLKTLGVNKGILQYVREELQELIDDENRDR